MFEKFGIELEYMIVDRDSLDIRPICDRLLAAQHGSETNELELDGLGWSNELALHVVELKTPRPARQLPGLAPRFQSHVKKINALLAPMNARLLPAAMHPWMDPFAQMRLWPHEQNEIYEAFDRIFDCRGHGWANLQSAHLNLPFSGDEEFGRLHAAIRLLLPILPALAASSPVIDARLTGTLDNRLAVYKTNAARVPSVAGRVIPEPVYTIDGYQNQLLRSIYDEIKPLDPAGLLQHEWLNARGAIARFDRGAIEVRVVDVQECPAADLAIAALSMGVLGLLMRETFTPVAEQQAAGVEPLAAVFDNVLVRADRAVIEDENYLRLLGWDRGPCTAQALWRHLLAFVRQSEPALLDPVAGEVEAILHHGCLARRIAAALGPEPSYARLRSVYGRLADCLARGVMFVE